MPRLTDLSSILIVIAALPCNGRAAQLSETSVKLHMVMGRPVVDSVFINGQGPFRFLLDTGAQTNQLDAAIARQLGLVPTFQVEMATVSGTIPVSGGRIVEVSLGSANASNQEFLFTALDGVHALSVDVQGVLGQEFLSRFDYLLDFARHRLLFGEAASEGGTRVGFETIDGCPAIETSEGKLVLDSGTNTTILYRPSFSGPEGPVVRTASGTAAVSTIQSLRLNIAGREYHLTRTASIPRALLGGDGVLPAGMFHAVFVSNSGKFAVLNPVTRSQAAP
jgi:hypothetical protein